jgi:predicted RNA-binding Zn ribbon-like protein
MPRTVTPAPLDAVVALVAAWSPVALDASDTSADRDAWREVVGVDGGPLAAGPDELHQLAGRFHRVFLGDSPWARREALNDLVAAVAPRPRVGPTGHEWEVSERTDAQVAALVLALWRHAGVDPDLERLGTCAGVRCLDPFVDATQGSNRRYCSLICQNRAKVAAYRARHRQGA